MAEKSAQASQIQYLEAAKSAVIQKEEAEQKAAAQRDEVNQLETVLQREKDALEDKIQTALKKRRAEIETNYDKQIKHIQSDIDRAKKKRESARAKAVGNRVEEETRQLRTENEKLTNELHNSFKKNHVPVVFRSRFFYALHYPATFREILTLFLYALIVLFILPAGLVLLFTDHTTKWIVLVFLPDILIFVLLYALIHSTSHGRYGEALKEGRRLKNKIHENKTAMAHIEKGIRRDTNDDPYDLKEFDDRLAELQTDYDETFGERKAALDAFDQEKKTQIREEMTANGAERIRELERNLEKSEKVLNELRRDEQYWGRKLNEKFGNDLGAEFLQREKLEQLIAAFRNGASNMTEAQQIVRGGKTEELLLLPGKNVAESEASEEEKAYIDDEEV